MLRRRRYIIKPLFQLRYTGIILLAVFAVAAVCILTTYYSSVNLLGAKLAHVYPQGRLVLTIKEINLIMVYRIVFLVPLIVFIGIMLSHRIAGPAYRIERTLKEIGKGNFDVFIKLRKYDELGGIADAVNNMVADLKKQIKETH